MVSILLSIYNYIAKETTNLNLLFCKRYCLTDINTAIKLDSDCQVAKNLSFFNVKYDENNEVEKKGNWTSCKSQRNFVAVVNKFSDKQFVINFGNSQICLKKDLNKNKMSTNNRKIENVIDVKSKINIFQDPDNYFALQILSNAIKMTKCTFITKYEKELKGISDFVKVNIYRIKKFLIDFFQNDKTLYAIGNSEFSFFELMYIYVILYKKNFNNWNFSSIDLEALQKSIVIKRKDHLIKFLFKQIFKYIFKTDEEK